MFHYEAMGAFHADYFKVLTNEQSHLLRGLQPGRRVAQRLPATDGLQYFIHLDRNCKRMREGIGFSFGAVVHWKLHGFGVGANRQYYIYRKGVLDVDKLYMKLMQREDYLHSDKPYPGEFPQMHLEDETFYHSHRVAYKAKDGGKNIPLLQRLHLQFYVYLC